MLELTHGWPFTVTFDAYFAFTATHCLICRVFTFTEERTVTVVALREWFVKYGWIRALWVMFFSIFSSVLWPKTFNSNQMLSSSGLNLTLASLGRWNNASTSGFRWERYALIVLTGHPLEPEYENIFPSP